MKFQRVVKIHSDLLVCPVLPYSVPDNVELYKIFTGLKEIRNCRLDLRMNLDWPPYRSEKIVFSWGDGLQSPLTFPRGVYTVSGYQMTLKDWAGLFLLKVPGTINSSLTVYPGKGDRQGELHPSGRMNSERRVAASVLKNQDQFDARPYIAGDDPRRIHWKMLARHEELFIREGSGIIRDRKAVLVCLDGQVTWEKTLFRLRGSYRKLDLLLRYMAGLLEDLEGGDLVIRGIFPGSERLTDLNGLPLEKLRALLASIPPQELRKLPEPQGQSFGSVLFFSARLPAPSLLDMLERQHPSAHRTVIVSEGADIPRGRRGWTVVQA